MTKVMTDYNRKSHTRLRFVPKSMALDDIKRSIRTLAERIRFTEPTRTREPCYRGENRAMPL